MFNINLIFHKQVLKSKRFFIRIVYLFLTAVLVSGCIFDDINVEPVDSRTDGEIRRDEKGSLFGLGDTFNSDDNKVESNSSNTLGVNVYLWRASIETLSVSPLAKVDPKLGIIQTEWVSVKSSSTSQVRIGVLILSEVLKSNAVKVNVYKRYKRGSIWVSSAASFKTNEAIQNAILSRARELLVNAKK